MLRPGGSLVNFNYSYRADVARDTAELTQLGPAAGLRMIGAGTRPFRCWDGVMFYLQREADLAFEIGHPSTGSG